MLNRLCEISFDMNNFLCWLLILLVTISCSCKEKKVANDSGKKGSTLAKVRADPNFYNSIEVFGDSSYMFSTHLYDSLNSLDASHNNTSITFRKTEAGKNKILFQDSVFCMYPQIELQDFNNDMVEDILVFHNTVGRSNPTYYLYLKDPKNKMLTRIKGFENLPNPDFDIENKIIVSSALSGTNYYRFYRIDKNNKLISLGNGYAEKEDDSAQYKTAVSAILRKYH